MHFRRAVGSAVGGGVAGAGAAAVGRSALLIGPWRQTGDRDLRFRKAAKSRGRTGGLPRAVLGPVDVQFSVHNRQGPAAAVLPKSAVSRTLDRFTASHHMKFYRSGN